MRKPKVVAKIIPKLQSFTIDSVCKYQFGSEKTLIEKLFYYPNFGQGFKIFLRIRPYEYYIVNNLVVKNNRHGKVFGIYHEDNKMENKIKKVRRTLQDGRWDIEYPQDKCYSENGVEYDIKKIEDLVSVKKQLLAKRNKEIGYIPFFYKLCQEKKKAKLEATAKKKK